VLEPGGYRTGVSAATQARPPCVGGADDDHKAARSAYSRVKAVSTRPRPPAALFRVDGHRPYWAVIPNDDDSLAAELRLSSTSMSFARPATPNLTRVRWL